MAKGKKKNIPPKKPKNEPISESISETPAKRRWVRWPVFLFSVSIVLLSLVSVVFPALIHSTFSEFKDLEFYTTLVDPFELGALALPLIAVNLALLGFGFLYYKKGLSRKKLLDFDIPKKASFFLIASILAIYVAFSVSELATPETWGDYANVENIVINQGVENLQGFDLYVRYSLLTISHDVFGNMKVVPFVASIALLITTYFITKEITQKRIAGIFSLLLVLQSNIFLTYDTSSTYSNFWILFYLVSLYLVLKKWHLSPVAYVLSVFSKSLTAVFMPMSIFFILNNKTSRTRLYLGFSYGVLVIIGIIGITVGNSDVLFSSEVYIPENFWKGFASFAYQLRFDPIVLIFLLPLTVSLFLKSRDGFYHADSILVLISGFMVIPPLLITFTSQTNEPYRLIPLIVFFAIGAGVLLSRRSVNGPNNSPS